MYEQYSVCTFLHTVGVYVDVKSVRFRKTFKLNNFTLAWYTRVGSKMLHFPPHKEDEEVFFVEKELFVSR